MKNILQTIALLSTFFTLSSCYDTSESKKVSLVPKTSTEDSIGNNKRDIQYIIDKYLQSLDIPILEANSQYDEIFQIRISSFYDNDLVATLFKKEDNFSIEVKIMVPEGLSLPNVINENTIAFSDFKRNISKLEWDKVATKMDRLISRLDSFPSIQKRELAHSSWHLIIMKDGKLIKHSSSKMDNDLQESFESIFSLVNYKVALKEIK